MSKPTSLMLANHAPPKPSAVSMSGARDDFAGAECRIPPKREVASKTPDVDWLPVRTGEPMPIGFFMSNIMRTALEASGKCPNDRTDD